MTSALVRQMIIDGTTIGKIIARLVEAIGRMVWLRVNSQ
jgi:hypothetical protein